MGKWTCKAPSVLLLSREAACMSDGQEPLDHVVPVSSVKLRHSTSLLTQGAVPWRPAQERVCPEGSCGEHLTGRLHPNPQHEEEPQR